MNLANKISIARILIIPFFVMSIFYYRTGGDFYSYLPAIIFAIAVISDGIDGIIARAFKQKTDLGVILDPLADKLLLTAAFICLSMLENLPSIFKIPPWVTITVLSRDIIIILGVVVIQQMKGSVEVRPTPLGKVTTFFQMMTIVGVLLKVPNPHIIWNVTVALTILSGMHYVIIGSRMLSEKADKS